MHTHTHASGKKSIVNKQPGLCYLLILTDMLNVGDFQIIPNQNLK